VRVLHYRRRRGDGTVVEAEWFTNLSKRKVSSLSLYRMARSRWEIEKEGFNDYKSRQGMEHICHHQTNSLLWCWLLTLLALVIGRLYRIRFLHRGQPAPTSAIDRERCLSLALSTSPFPSPGKPFTKITTFPAPAPPVPSYRPQPARPTTLFSSNPETVAFRVYLSGIPLSGIPLDTSMAG
jgi:hypothetical protein